MPPPTPLTYALPTRRRNPFFFLDRLLAYLVTYAPPSFLALLALGSALLYLSPLGRIGPADAIMLHAPWVQQQATFGPWTPAPFSTPQSPTLQRTGTIDVLCYTFTFTDYTDPATYPHPLFTRIPHVQTHYLLLIPTLLAWILLLLTAAYAWQRFFQSHLAPWLPPRPTPTRYKLFPDRL